ncbi:MAG: glycosyltransferase family 25 protein [Stenomitos rutilans HA7619-LM2]|jgi:glycosyl transferase family 25|nr:glycosyltransferase family 25 protein [Stenomitos rutilans HA7619-LM2]
MRFSEFFDCAFVINLPARTDRRREITKELEDAGMPFKPGDVELFEAIRPDSPGPFASIGYRGAFLSHLNVLKQAKARGLKNVLVMEDDLQLRQDFNQYEEILLAELFETDWDLVHFGYGCDERFDTHKVNVPLLQPFSGEIIGAQLYAVNGKALDQLIHFFEAVLQRPAGHPEGSPMSPDGVFNVFKWQHPAIVRLIAIPSFGNQRSSRSDISTQWFDQLPVLSSLAGLARKLGFARSIKSILRSLIPDTSG